MKDKITSSQKDKNKINLKFNKEKDILHEKNAQLNDLFNNNNNYKNEKNLVNKEIKLRKTDEKNNTSETELIRLQKKKRVYNTILGSEKNEKFQNFDSNFVKKKKIQLSMLNVIEPMTKFIKFRNDIKLIQIKSKFQK